MGFSRRSVPPRAIVIGLNPSPVDRGNAWSPRASATAALSYLAFDKPHVPTEVHRWFDMRNLNDEMIDEVDISRIDPVEAMSHLTAWAHQGMLQGPMVACGRTVSLMLDAFAAAFKVDLFPIARIPHPSCLWLPHRGVPISAWKRARNELCQIARLPALPDIVDQNDIDNAEAGFGAFLNQAMLAEMIADDEAATSGLDIRQQDDDDWSEEVGYWRRSMERDERSDQIERSQAAERLIADGGWHAD